MGTFEIQVFVSLIVVLGAAFVALICDYLKGSNDRLRERNAELRARHEERETLESMMAELQTKSLDTAMRAQREALEAMLENAMFSRGNALPAPAAQTSFQPAHRLNGSGANPPARLAEAASQRQRQLTQAATAVAERPEIFCAGHLNVRVGHSSRL